MLTITTTVSQPPPVAMWGNTVAVLGTNDALGAGLPDFGSTAAVLYRPKVGFGAASTGLNQLPCCPNATAAKANTKLTDKVVLLIDFIPHLFESPEILLRDHFFNARVFV